MTFIAAYDTGISGIIYDLRIPIAIVSVVFGIIALVVAYRLGWFAAARRHPMRAGILTIAVLVIALPIGFYMASPLFIRSSLNEDAPVAIADPTSSPSTTPSDAPIGSSPPAASPTTPVTPEPTATAFEPTSAASGSFVGTDDFHYGSGTATIIETAPGRYTLRLEDFSVRNGPDLFVVLSPDPTDYADDALEVGRLKATDGAFNYELPAGFDPAGYASALIWCKQFAHLFAYATFTGG